MRFHPASLARGLALTAILWIGTEAAWAVFAADAREMRICTRFFILAFGGLNSVLLTWAASLPPEAAADKSGRRALGGLTGHFAGSVALSLLYFYLWFDGSRACAMVAVTAYLAAFSWFVYRLSVLK